MNLGEEGYLWRFLRRRIFGGAFYFQEPRFICAKIYQYSIFKIHLRELFFAFARFMFTLFGRFIFDFCSILESLIQIIIIESKTKNHQMMTVPSNVFQTDRPGFDPRGGSFWIKKPKHRTAPKSDLRGQSSTCWKVTFLVKQSLTQKSAANLTIFQENYAYDVHNFLKRLSNLQQIFELSFVLLRTPFLDSCWIGLWGPISLLSGTSVFVICILYNWQGG